MIVGDIDIAASFADDRTAGGKVTGPPLDPVARLVDALLVGAEDADGHAGGRLVIEFTVTCWLPPVRLPIIAPHCRRRANVYRWHSNASPFQHHDQQGTDNRRRTCAIREAFSQAAP
jgi:hypothetical protein